MTEQAKKAAELADDEMDTAYKVWWREMTARGDPSRRPFLSRDSFNAGWQAARAPSQSDVCDGCLTPNACAHEGCSGATSTGRSYSNNQRPTSSAKDSASSPAHQPPQDEQKEPR